MDASIVIATLNRKEMLESCLRCLNEQDYPAHEFEVIEVEDGSTDGSMEMVNAWPARFALRCVTAGRQGCGPARNLGVSEARGDIIIFMDDDAFAPPWFISEHMKTHRTAGRPVFADGPAVYVSGREAMEKPPFISWAIKMKAWLDFFGSHFICVNVSCPRQDFLRVGGFDMRFGKAYGFQDNEMGFRFQQAGVAGVRNRRAYVLHHSSGTPTLEMEMKKRSDRGGTAALFYAKYRLPEVKKIIHWHYMKWDSRLERWGLVRWATPEKVAAMKQDGHPLYPLARKILLTHLFAVSLRKGLEAAGITEQE